MVVVDAAEAGQQHLFLDDLVVRVLGVNDEVGRLAQIDLVAQHGNPDRCLDVQALVEHRRLFRTAIAVGVLENDDAIAARTERHLARGIAAASDRHVRPAAIVHAFGRPDAAALVDRDHCWIHDGGLRGPELDLEPGGGGQRLERCLWIDLNTDAVSEHRPGADGCRGQDTAAANA